MPIAGWHHARAVAHPGARALALLLASSSIAGSTGQALALEWPSRQLTMVIPFAAGGPVDTVGRILGQYLREVLGQQLIMENVGEDRRIDTRQGTAGAAIPRDVRAGGDRALGQGDPRRGHFFGLGEAGPASDERRPLGVLAGTPHLRFSR